MVESLLTRRVRDRTVSRAAPVARARIASRAPRTRAFGVSHRSRRRRREFSQERARAVDAPARDRIRGNSGAQSSAIGLAPGAAMADKDDGPGHAEVRVSFSRSRAFARWRSRDGGWRAPRRRSQSPLERDEGRASRLRKRARVSGD